MHFLIGQVPLLRLIAQDWGSFALSNVFYALLLELTHHVVVEIGDFLLVIIDQLIDSFRTISLNRVQRFSLLAQGPFLFTSFISQGN